jgi:hypothetical protein
MLKNMAKKKTAKRAIQTWAFIDTNIYLDFYRSNKDARLQTLDKLEECSSRIISTYQVEMEFLKNRQTELIKSVSEFKSINQTAPAVISDGQIQAATSKISTESKKRDNLLKNKVERMLKTPNTNDPVYKVFNNIFSSPHEHVLTRDMNVRHKIKRLAWRRFMLGYPPRKKNDTSIGDALNWEWIIHCANNLSGKFFIVTRDSDFGSEYLKKPYLNDQLKKEFKHADVQRMRNIITKDFTGSTKSQSGYKRVDEQHEEGEIWEEGGRQWTVKNGLKQNITKLDSLKKAVRVPLACPKCNGSMSYHLSKQVYKINKMCFNCFIDYEAELRKNGLYDDYLMHARKGNLEFFIKGLEQQFQESLSVDDTFVTEHGDIEEWKGNKTKEKALFTEKFGEYLSYLKSKLD